MKNNAKKQVRKNNQLEYKFNTNWKFKWLIETKYIKLYSKQSHTGVFSTNFWHKRNKKIEGIGGTMIVRAHLPNLID